MAKYITRTFITTIVHSVAVTMVDNQPVTEELADIVIHGKVNDEKALKAAKKAYPDKNVLLKGIDYQSELRGMTVEDFMKYSVPMVDTAAAEDDDPADNQ